MFSGLVFSFFCQVKSWCPGLNIILKLLYENKPNISREIDAHYQKREEALLLQIPFVLLWSCEWTERDKL